MITQNEAESMVGTLVAYLGSQTEAHGLGTVNSVWWDDNYGWRFDIIFGDDTDRFRPAVIGARQQSIRTLGVLP